MTSVQLHDLIILHPTLSAKQKAQCAMALAEADKALCDGADEEEQERAARENDTKKLDVVRISQITAAITTDIPQLSPSCVCS